MAQLLTGYHRISLPIPFERSGDSQKRLAVPPRGIHRLALRRFVSSWKIETPPTSTGLSQVGIPRGRLPQHSSSRAWWPRACGIPNNKNRFAEVREKTIGGDLNGTGSSPYCR